MQHQSDGKKSWPGAAGGAAIGAAAIGLLLASPPARTADDAAAVPDRAAPEGHDVGTVDDPLEPVNRSLSEVNRFLRLVLIDPLVDGYQAVTPDPVEQAISNAVSNLTEPATAVSSLLQGDGDNAATATGRFLVNSTLGLAGTRDPATGMGLEQRREDLGQAIGAHGVDGGPHLVLPLLGPSNLRDVVGDVVTALVTPLPLAAGVGTEAVRYADNQDDIQALEAGALDPYVAEKEAYEQYRRYQVENGAGALPTGPSFADEAPPVPTTEAAAKD